MPYPPNMIKPDAKIGIMSKGVANIPHLETLLGHSIVKSSWGRFKENIDAVAGWGYKPTSKEAREYAKKNHLPYLAIEDGFLRSVGLGHEHPPQSIVVDDRGIYYDANSTSRLEILIKQALNTEQKQRTKALIEQWREAGVSKYNHLREYEGTLPTNYVLVADQTNGDASVELGLANKDSFVRMIQDALRLYPDSIIAIKTHPDVVAGKKRSYIKETSVLNHSRIEVLNEDVHPVRLIKEAQAIFTVTSQIGFEGLIWGKKVHTYGMPFYAGWGLTQDLLPQPNKRRQINLLQLVHAALIDYPHYLDPESNQRCEVEDLIAWIQFQRQLRTEFTKDIYAYRFSFNKRYSVKRFLAGSNVHFVSNLNRIPQNSTVAVWGSTDVKRSDLKVLRLEDGFLRSVGLGADLVRPLSWVVDDCGIYYDPRQPSKLELILQNLKIDPNMQDRAKSLQQKIIESGISKYNLSGKEWNRPTNIKRVILVPGQVETDASIAKGAGKIRRNIDLLRTVRKENPDAYIVYKPHPDIHARLRKVGSNEHLVKNYSDEIVTNVSINRLLDLVDEVHVMTSLTGFEALIRKKKVFTYGKPFYAGYGLTTDRYILPERIKTLNLYELIFGVLIIYPRYVTIQKNLFATPEESIKNINKKINQNKKNIIINYIRRIIVRSITLKY